MGRTLIAANPSSGEWNCALDVAATLARDALANRFREGDMIAGRVGDQDSRLQRSQLQGRAVSPGVDPEIIEVGDDLVERAHRQGAGAGAGVFR